MMLPVLGELGRFPVTFRIICQILEFWIHVLEHNPSSHLKYVYDQMFETQTLDTSFWIGFVKKILCSVGLNHVWNNQNTLSIKRLKYTLLEKLEEKYIVYWKEKIQISTKLDFYRQVVTEYKNQFYLTKVVNIKHRQALCRLRTSSHSLKIEQGRYLNITRAERKCDVCGVLEDEKHFLDDCIRFNHLRLQLKKNIQSIDPVYEFTNPSILIQFENYQGLIAKFVYECFNAIH